MKAIENKAPNTLILHKVGPVGEDNSGFCFKMLIGTDDSDMYYYNQHLIDKTNPNGFLPADLKRLARLGSMQHKRNLIRLLINIRCHGRE